MLIDRSARDLLAATAALAIIASTHTAGHAAEADQLDTDRSYAPSDIIVTARYEGYVIDDGSTAMKTPTALIDTPQAVNVITRDQLDDQGVRQLGEALRYVPGVSMESGEGNRDAVFIRGQESTADFYLNGLRDDAQYYRSLYNVERVEVLKGANALTFGRGGGGGIVNRVSKVADVANGFVRGSASLDTFGGFSLISDGNAPVSEAAALRLNAAYEEFDSHRDFYEGRFIGFAPTASLALGERTRLVLAYSYDDDDRLADRGVPSLAGRPIRGFDRTLFGDREFNVSDTQTHIARARIDHQASDTLSFDVSLQYANYDKVYANVLPGSATATTVSLSGYRNDTARENWIGQGNLVWQGETGAIGHTLLAGFEAMRQETSDSRNLVRFADANGATTSITVPLARVLAIPALSLDPKSRDRRSKLTSLSAYVQDQVELGEHVQVVAGIRFESFDLDTVNVLNGQRNDRKDEKWSPRFGLVVKPSEALSFYASCTRSFLPQAGDQFVILSSEAASLAPEKFDNYEIGAKWAPRPNLLVTAALFRLDRSNTQAPDPGGSGAVVLTGKTRVEGFEIGVAGDLTENWHVNAGYTFLDGEIRSTTSAAPAGRRMEQLPKHHLAAWSRYDFSKNFGVGLGLVHSSRQFASVSNAVVLPAYTRVDAAAYFSVSENVALQINVENLFDERYYASAHGDNNIQPAKPLSATFGARVAF